MYYLEKSAYDIVVTFWPPTMIRRPGNCAPLLLSLRLWCYSIKIRRVSENKKIFKSERHELLFREHLQFSNTIAYRMDLAQTVNKGYWRHFKLLRVVFVSLQILPHAFFRRGPVFPPWMAQLRAARGWSSQDRCTQHCGHGEFPGRYAAAPLSECPPVVKAHMQTEIAAADCHGRSARWKARFTLKCTRSHSLPPPWLHIIFPKCRLTLGHYI